MKRLIGSVAAVFLTLVLFFVAVPVLMMPSLVTGSKAPEVPAHALLELDLSEALPDQPVSSSFTRSVMSVIAALASAETDERIAGVFVRLGGSNAMPLAQAEEIRGALKAFQATGKFVVAHAQGFSAQNPGAYYTASKADEVWMQPNGVFTSLEPQRRAQTGAPAAVSVKSLADNLVSSLAGAAQGSVAKINADRMMADLAVRWDMPPEHIATVLQEGPYLANQVLDEGLITHVGSQDEAHKRALDLVGKGARALGHSDYLLATKGKSQGGTLIAVVYAQGEIDSDTSALTAKAIRDAADHGKVEAIVFRVNSPGGSAIASDQIWNAVTHARNSGTPVVVSMGAVAASGGYYVAMAADKIIAQPSTITGSIGMNGGKFLLGETWGAIGLEVSEAAAGGLAANTAGDNEPLTEQWQAVNEVLGNFYADFTSRVAMGRGLTPEAVNKVAGGKIWTGAQAMNLGLVDELGGFRTAVDETKKIIGLEANAAVELRTWPGSGTRRERFAAMQGVFASVAEVLLMFSQIGQVDTIKELMESVYTGAVSSAVSDAGSDVGSGQDSQKTGSSD